MILILLNLYNDDCKGTTFFRNASAYAGKSCQTDKISFLLVSFKADFMENDLTVVIFRITLQDIKSEETFAVKKNKCNFAFDKHKNTKNEMVRRVAFNLSTF